MAAQTVIKLRRDTAANWTSANPTLAAGEQGFETDTGKVKIGNGSTAWTSLSYSNPGGAIAQSQVTDLADDLADKAPTASPVFTGTVTLPGNPTLNLHAATKQYVDNTASGIVAKPQVLGATTANIDATYSNGTLGVGATLTHNSNGAFPSTAGGATGWALGKGILVKNQTNKAQNGRYYISDMGSPSTPYVLTRCSYCDEASEIPGAYIFVQSGTNAGTGWIQVVADPSTFAVGTDDINVFQFSGAGTITAGTNISVSGNEVSTVADPTFTSASIGNVSNTEIQYLDGVTSAIQSQLDDKATTAGTLAQFASTTSAQLAGVISNETGSGSLVFGDNPALNYPVLKSPKELTTISATAATGTVAYDQQNQADLFYTSNASANFTLNFRGSSSLTLNNAMSVGETATLVFRNTNGSTPYYPNVIQIDGTTVTPKWLGGTAPSAGNASSIDVYSFVITKTANATFTVLGSVSKFA
jgi:hypothetical protein